MTDIIIPPFIASYRTFYRGTNLKIIISKINMLLKLNDTETIQLYFSTLSTADITAILKCAIYNYNLDTFINLVPYIKNFDIRIDNDIFLILAVESNNIDSVTYFIDQGLDITTCDNYIINYSLQKISNEMLELIISYGADININNGTPLIKAVRFGSIKCVEMLINHGADYSLQNYEAVDLSVERGQEFVLFFINLGIDINMNNDIMLKSAIDIRNYEVIKLLLDRGADMTKLSPGDLYDIIASLNIDIISLFLNLDFSVLNSYFNKNDIFPLLNIDPMILACILYDDMHYDNFDAIKVIDLDTYYDLVERNKLLAMDVNTINNYLSELDNEKQLECIKMLIEYGKLDIIEQLNFDYKINNDCLLLSAVTSNQVAIVTYFLDLGLDMYANNGTAIRQIRNDNILQLFIDRGLEIDYDDDCLFVLACGDPQLSCVKLLIENNANIYAREGEAIIKLIKNISTGKNIILQDLITRGLNINYGSGIFLSAAIRWYETFNLLLENGADVQYLNVDNLISVIRMRNSKSIKLLLDAGVDFSVLNSYVASEKALEFVSLLMNHEININLIIKIIYEYDI